MENTSEHTPPVTENIDATFRRLSEKADLVYFFVALYSNYIGKTRNYGLGPEMTMTEAHMLNSIALTPGTTVTDLAHRWERTTGAVCQTLSKLDKKGLIERKKTEGNSKTVHLYPSELGWAVDRAHMMYDIADITATTQELLESCTMDELNTFYKVLGIYLDLIRRDQRSEK